MAQFTIERIPGEIFTSFWLFAGSIPGYPAFKRKNNASYDEIAKITGITVEAVRSCLYRARMALLRGLQEQKGQR